MLEQPVRWLNSLSPAVSLLPLSSNEPMQGVIVDRFARPLRDLRISVTDRCNFRCTYCMPKEIFDKDYPYLNSSSMLSFEEIERVARIAIKLGVTQLRLTGGEPLLRKNLEQLVASLSQLNTENGERIRLAMTTNGSLLEKKASILRQVGLDRITVSLDAIDEQVFRRMNDVDFSVNAVLRGIDAALAAGLAPVKVNVVVKRGYNDDQILPLIEHFRGSGVILRFIEFMDVGSTNGWKSDYVFPSDEIVSRVQERYTLEALPHDRFGETAQRYKLADGSLELGLISSITAPFCGTCNRARLSTDGKLYTCLFGSHGADLRSILRDSRSSDETLQQRLASIWRGREDRYSERRATLDASRAAKVEMSYIGG
ncbi:GTP 3',8-cyclase MoaA [Herbaspirillum sp. meg3]|nr:GTP 3',8-cyclase MoaA [Herbaspirillum sp. meg3]